MVISLSSPLPFLIAAWQRGREKSSNRHAKGLLSSFYLCSNNHILMDYLYKSISSIIHFGFIPDILRFSY